MHGSRPGLDNRIARPVRSACRVTVPLAIAATLALSAPARADEGNATAAEARSLARARSAIEAVDYASALGAVRPLLGSPSARVRVNALEITAVADLLLGRLADGRLALEQLYTLEPAFVLDDPTLPPRVTSELESAAAKPRARAVTPVIVPVDGSPLRFELRAGGATQSVSIACRGSGAEPFAALATTNAVGAWRFDVPHAPSWCHAVAFDEDSLALGRLGTAKSPFELRAHGSSSATSGLPNERPPTRAATSEGHAVTSRWWFWTGAAAVVVAGVAIAYVVTRPSPSPTAPRSEVTVSALRGAALAW